MSDFTADHNGFYCQEAPFIPWIQEQADPLQTKSNAVLIRLPAHLNDDLDWTKEVLLAQEIASSGRAILWEIDLGLATYQFSPDDSAAFYSFSVAVEEFTARIWPAFQNHTFGVALYRGPFQPSHNFPFFRWESAFTDWMRDLPSGTTYDLYCAQILAEYLHRLISFLPDTVLPFALIDVRGIGSPAKMAQLLSKERFEHIHLALKGALFPFQGLTWNEGFLSHEAKTPAPIGIYLPNDSYVDANVIAQLDSVMAELDAFRIIPEEKLTEQWDGLDKLIVPKHAISTQGNRKLQGFIAAGGIIIS
jgi:hypothetical protein